MTSIKYENLSQFPYTDKISAGEENRVDFIYQFVKYCYTESSNNFKYFHTAHYILGGPNEFPNYGDFPEAFTMRTFGFDISISPWQEIEIDYLPQNYRFKAIDNHIDFQFHEAVYPIRVSVYEIYNPGNIIRIWAQISDNRWFLLWNGLPQIVPPTSRLFSPPLQSCNFKTNKLRLEFKPSSWDYYTKLDAVMLIGTSKLILPRNPEESITNLLKRISCVYFRHENEDVHNLTAYYKNAHQDIIHFRQNLDKYCIIYESDLTSTSYKKSLVVLSSFRKLNPEIPNCVQPFRQRYSRRLLLKNDLNLAKRIELSSDESEKLSRYNLSMCPDEIILKILKNLDLTALCCMNQVNKRFNNITRDYQLYTSLNVRNVCHINPTYICNIFCYFAHRCKYLHQLDLTASEFLVYDFVKFLDNCGKHLTHLRLSKCQSIDHFVLSKISKLCKNLKKLDVRFCRRIEDKEFLCLKKLKNLEYLNIGGTYISSASLCKILYKNQQMREFHMENSGINLDAVAIELKNSCSNLEVINLECSILPLTPQGINALADCKNLRKINLRTDISMFDDDSLSRLLSAYQRLEEIHLSHIVFNDHNLQTLTQCKNLKQLYLYDTEFISPTYSVIFEQCPKLQKFHLMYCKTNRCLINQWRRKYPQVSIYVGGEIIRRVFNVRSQE